ISVCYESLFPNVSRRHVLLGGADILGGVSFNTWLGNTNWPILHAAYIPFRAVENGRAAFFLNNNGPSLAVLPDGEIT
ncbi:nitrilase-related carbon-nitrogen hydrolase, partial [Klebsiella pneumoniae]|uniref:nitrilase-related carbon-nitrogen hydrolase n=1 Tax=Klebsiella pneumoniae TaxID=573 RepID=UPI004046575D